MIGEEIILHAAGNAIEKEMNKLTPKTKSILINSLTAVFGVTVGIIAITRLIKLFGDNGVEG